MSMASKGVARSVDVTHHDGDGNYSSKRLLLGFMGLAQLRNSNKSQENLKSPYKWMAKG
jgi:hypothetical protein